MPSPVRGQSGDRPITQIPAALMDMLAATLRGGVKTTMGMPGDLEQLGRMGINAMGGNVDKYPVLPTSEFFDKFLPSDGGRMPTAEKLGEFAPLPMTLGAVPAAKQATSFAKALRGVEAPVDMGRRGALQTIGKAGAGAAAATVAPHMMAEALRSAPEAGAVVKSVAPTVAKAATGLSRGAALSVLNKMRDFHGVDSVKNLDHLKGDSFDPDKLLDSFAKILGDEKSAENIVKAWERGSPGEELGDTVVNQSAFMDWVKKQPYYEETHPSYGVPPGEWEKVREPFTTHGPYSTADRWLEKNASTEEILEAVKKGQIPPEWAKNGVTENHLTDSLFPIMGGPARGAKFPGTDIYMSDLYGIIFE